MNTINIGGQLLLLDRPLVMGIMNITPDSFFSGSRVSGEEAIRLRIRQMVSQGADLIDIGGYSTRPGAMAVSAEEERQRLELPLRILREEYPDMPLSIDTFRADIVRWAYENFGAFVVNDVSGGMIDPRLFATVGELHLPYVLMHTHGDAETMAVVTPEYTNLFVEVLDYFIERIGQLQEAGVRDIIIDPGFGFAKTHEDNYTLMARLADFKRMINKPLLVGISRKRMIYQEVGGTAEEALNGSTVLHTYSLMQGANILRVHDVRAAVEAVKIVGHLQSIHTKE